MAEQKKGIINMPEMNNSVSQKLMKICLRQPNISTNILCQQQGNKAYLTFNRPTRLNSFSIDMYFTFNEYLNWANENQSIKFIIIKGAGENFCSGNDLANFYLPEMEQVPDIRLRAAGMAQCLQILAASIIKSKKPIFAIVQGKCIGFAFTQLALYDKVFATKDATFMAPLVRIAQGPQMASSYTFPKIFGQALGEQFIIKAKNTTTKQLEKYNFVECCENLQSANKRLQQHLQQLQQLDWNSYLEARKLMRKPDRESLLQANTDQCNNLIQRWSNPDLPNYLMEYMNKKKAAKNGKAKL